MVNKNYYKSLVILILFLFIFEGIVFFFTGNRPYWGDEAHFVKTVRQFGNDLSIYTIKHYNEMSTPLPFILYSIWGRIFSFDVQVLRIFSIIIAFATYLLFHRLVYAMFKEIKISLLTTAFIILHPYMVGLSIFVFTDMLAILFIVISCISIRERHPIVLSISLACGLLCRQYLIFYVLAVGLYYAGEYYRSKSNDIIKMLISCLISLVPLAILGVLWKGLSPDNELKEIYLDEGYRYHLSYLSLYICQFSVYLLPIILISWRVLYRNIKIIIISFVLSNLYWLFPVRACKYQTDKSIYTVGFFHRLVKAIFENQFAEDVIFYIAFFLGLPIFIFTIKDIFLRWKKKHFTFPLFLDLAIISFLIVMPFSYLCWEKYFLPVLPLVTMRILLAKYSDNMHDSKAIPDRVQAKLSFNRI